MVSVKIDIAAVKAQAERLGKVFASPRGLMAALANWLIKVSREAFQKQRSPEGAAWAPLSEKYALRKARLRPGKPILQFSGTMLRALAHGSTDTSAWVENRQPQAAVHQHGGRAGRKLAALIPARPYLPSAAFAEAEGARIADEFVQDVIDAKRSA